MANATPSRNRRGRSTYDSSWLPTRYTPRGSDTGDDTRTFLSAIRRNPRQLGAIAPSSRRLADLAASIVPQTAAVVAELGPGTGVISDAIHRRMRDGSGRHLAIELNPDCARHLERSRGDWLEVIRGDAAELGSLLFSADVTEVDAVVSALPWTLMGSDTQQAILGEVAKAMAPGAAFTTVTTVTALPWPAARRFRGLLREVFRDVHTTSMVWRNVPPALLYVCRKPREART
ncbi:SAM-dependent methyltransferase [Microbispora sp. NBRC 16548]|uniref:class I SAM-dependent methyltransferase n=1 Tax=Microbispora sp. NBRC 16548 TaxID=3030994 RepID=UPI0024A304D4|nr:SAM-dependent methyltransferase [Microbispora sp. NBRC 16548]GLX06622.1 methyltransferase [Microbispora sp. NBRC 16548]